MNVTCWINVLFGIVLLTGSFGCSDAIPKFKDLASDTDVQQPGPILTVDVSSHFVSDANETLKIMGHCSSKASLSFKDTSNQDIQSSNMIIKCENDILTMEISDPIGLFSLSPSNRKTNMTIIAELNNLVKESKINISLNNSPSVSLASCATLIAEGSGLYNCSFSLSDPEGDPLAVAINPDSTCQAMTVLEISPGSYEIQSLVGMNNSHVGFCNFNLLISESFEGEIARTTSSELAVEVTNIPPTLGTQPPLFITIKENMILLFNDSDLSNSDEGFGDGNFLTLAPSSGNDCSNYGTVKWVEAKTGEFSFVPNIGFVGRCMLQLAYTDGHSTAVLYNEIEVNVVPQYCTDNSNQYGDGTPSSPFLICNGNSLTKLALFGCSASETPHCSSDFKVTSNIDMSSQTSFTSIAEDQIFSGFFDGRGHIISNLTLTSIKDTVGLFSQSSGTLKDIILENFIINVTGTPLAVGGGVGALVGKSLGLGTISGVSITSGNISASGRTNVGSIVGINAGSFSKVSAIIGVGGTLSVTGAENVGGLIGSNTHNEPTNGISGQLISSGTVNISGQDMVGGFAGVSSGYINGTDSGTNELCQVKSILGSINIYSTDGAAASGHAGGLVGYQHLPSFGDGIKFCKVIAEVTGDIQIDSAGHGAGGLVGWLENSKIVSSSVLGNGNMIVISDSNSVGGFIGEVQETTATYSQISLSQVTDVAVTGAGDHVGGFIGLLSSSIGSTSLIQTSSANNNQVTGGNNIGGFVGTILLDNSNLYSGIINIIDTISSGSVRGTGSNTDVGGHIGSIDNNNPLLLNQQINIYRSSSTTTFSPTLPHGRWSGGFAGYCSNSYGTINQVSYFNTNPIYANYGAGGLIGFVESRCDIYNSSSVTELYGAFAGTTLGGLYGRVEFQSSLAILQAARFNLVNSYASVKMHSSSIAPLQAGVIGSIRFIGGSFVSLNDAYFTNVFNNSWDLDTAGISATADFWIYDAIGASGYFIDLNSATKIDTITNSNLKSASCTAGLLSSSEWECAATTSTYPIPISISDPF